MFVNEVEYVPLGLLAAAIEGRRLIRFNYGTDSLARVVEPYLVGRTTDGDVLLLGYQRIGPSRSGESAGWKHFRLAGMTGIELSEEELSDLRADYDRASASWEDVIAEV